MIKKIVLATNNLNKVKEIQGLLSSFNVEVKTLKDLNLGDPIEDGKTFLENSIIKARYAFERTGLPSLADDSGFCVESLNCFPGLTSSRFIKAVGGEDKAFNIINECISPYDKRAYFITSLAFIYKDANEKTIIKDFEGRINGKFVFPAKGEGGFGFDPSFIPDGYDKTFAEMPEEKLKISHRTRALNQFFDFFKALNG